MRDHTRALFDRLPHDVPLRGAEIGVYRAINSEELLDALPQLTLICVDPWVPYSEEWLFTQDPQAVAGDWGPIADNARQRLDRFGNRADIRRATSHDAVFEIPDQSLDFVFVDGCHSSPWVDFDVLYWPAKVKPGGIFGGHDYGPGTGWWPDVIRAVDAAAKRNGWILDRGKDTTWFFRA
jgi:hypothetical protein